MPQTHPQDPQSLWSSTHNGPDPTVDPVRWNTIWEERVKDNSLIRYGIELMMRSHGKECEILLTHIRYNTRFLVESQREVTSSYRGDTFNQKWKAISSSERRKHMLEGLVRSSINKPDSEADRIYCSDLTLDAMDGRDGEPFIQLVKAYIAPDASKLTPDTVRSYPHPSWAGEMKKEREKDKGSIRSLAWELIQLKRDRYICRFIDGTLESFVDIPRFPTQVVEVKPRSRKHKKLPKEIEERIKNLEHMVGKSILKEVTQRWRDEGSDSGRACEFCCKLDDPAQPLKRCQRCLNNIQRKIHYCSTECQKKDWPVHKKICGKSLTAETVRNVSVPTIIEPFSLSLDHLPRTFGFRFGPAAEGFTRSPALEKQIALLNDPSNADIDYFFFKRHSGKKYPINISPKSEIHRAVFEDARYTAFTKDDLSCTIQLVNHLARRGVKLSGAKDLTEFDILVQLQAEFPKIPLFLYSIEFEAFEKINNGRTMIEIEGDEELKIYEEKMSVPGWRENEVAELKAKMESDGTADVLKRAARSSALGKTVDAGEVRKILEESMGDDQGMGYVDRIMREMGYR